MSNHELRPQSDSFLFAPLGGAGEFGLNANLYGHDGQWLLVDCGMMLDRARGDCVLVPDLRFIERQRSHLLGIVVTHAHQDHIGAIPYIWNRLRCPIYATPFTARLIYEAMSYTGFAEHALINVIESGSRFALGPFDIEYIELTHSIPEPMGVLIRTAVGSVFHTGDWKLDRNPVCGPSYDSAKLSALGKEAILAIVCDSTNADLETSSASESSVLAPLSTIMSQHQGRIVVTGFSSNIARFITVTRAAAKCNRSMSLLGRSVRRTVSAARGLGYFEVDTDIIEERHAGLVPRENLVAIATGSQGEPRAALARLAEDSHPSLSLEQGDCVIFSSRVIPGNEEDIARLKHKFTQAGIRVIDTDHAPIHVSGHPSREELRKMYGWVRPLACIAVHGTEDKIKANAELAAQCHIPVQRAARNGDLYRLNDGSAELIGRVPIGRLMVEGRGLRRA